MLVCDTFQSLFERRRPKLFERRHAGICFFTLILFGINVWFAEPDLVGVWKFVKEVDRHADGSILEGAPPEGYKGQIIYTSNGYMSVQIFPVGRNWKPK